MSDTQEGRSYPIEEAVRAQKALRELAGLEPGCFPLKHSLE
jgi:hypothetical protein